MKNISVVRRSLAGLGLLVLILDGGTAIVGMRMGINVCIRTLIPSLFPFMILCGLINGNSDGHTGRLLRGIGKFCHMPPGCESILVTGFLGGYPVGARSVSALYDKGVITEDDARRMTVFCNNAGPSFLFGVLGSVFEDIKTIFLLWGVQILSALLMGHFLPFRENGKPNTHVSHSQSLSESLQSGIRVMGTICGWVIFFRTVLEYLEKWVFNCISLPLEILLTGMLELSNGCIILSQIQNEFLRFLMASAMLSFGGICISLQTASVCEKCIFKGYIRRKLLQCCVCVFISGLSFPLSRRFPFPLVILLLISIPFLIDNIQKNTGFDKKEVAF